MDLLHVLGVNAQPPLKLLLDDLHQREQVRIVNTTQKAKHVVPVASAVRAAMRQPGNYWWLGCDLLSTGHVLDSLVFDRPPSEPLRGEALVNTLSNFRVLGK